jgi:hypothetical protein
VLLVGGFAAQFAVSVGAHPAWPKWPTVVAAGGIAAAVVALLRWVLRPFAVRRAIAWDLEQQWAGSRDDKDRERALRDWWRFVEQWGTVLEVPRAEGEALPDYGARIVGKRGWERVGADKPLPSRKSPILLHDRYTVLVAASRTIHRSWRLAGNPRCAWQDSNLRPAD